MGHVAFEQHPTEAGERSGHFQEKAHHGKEVSLPVARRGDAVSHETQKVVGKEKLIEETEVDV